MKDIIVQTYTMYASMFVSMNVSTYLSIYPYLQQEL